MKRKQATPKYITRTGTLLGAVEHARSTAEELRDELQEWLDGLPENLQQGSKAEELQEAIDALEEGINALEEIEQLSEERVTNYQISYNERIWPKSTYWSRAKRLEASLEALCCCPTDRPDAPEGEDWTDDECGEWATACDNIEGAIDTLQGVSFPAMR